MIKLIKKFFKFMFEILIKFDSKNYLVDIIYEKILEKKKSIKIGDINLIFFIPNRITLERVNTFFTKEPEIIKWIESFKINSTFFDIGSNIGLYSCLAAKTKRSKVFSFEPSPLNLEVLTKNIFINNLNDQITIVKNPLHSENKISSMNFSNQQIGGALSTFSENFGFDGKKMNTVFSYNTNSFTLDNFVNFYKLVNPNYIKIDVDGIEHLILKSSLNTLKNVESVFVEINENFEDQNKKVKEILERSGLKLIERHKSINSSNINYNKIFNEIWRK